MEASGLDFGGPGLDFGGPETRFGKVLARFFRDSWPECQESQERQERLPKQDRDHKSAKSGWAAVLPPRGVSIKSAAPPPLEDLGLTSRGLRRLAIETGIVWPGKFSASSRQTCQKSYENLEKIDPDCAKSSPEASKIELGALQDAILKDI